MFNGKSKAASPAMSSASAAATNNGRASPEYTQHEQNVEFMAEGKIHVH